MTLNELRYLVTLAQVRHFGKAAKLCFVSQPTLSVAIKKLEEKLGVSLFERSNQQLSVTPIGQQVVDRARNILEQLDDMDQLVKNAKDPLQGEIKLGAIFTIGPYLFPRFIPNLAKSAPDMPLFIEENYTANLRQQLLSGRLDAAIIALPFTGADIVTKAIYQEDLVVLLPTQHPLAKQDTIDQQQLANEPLMLLGEGHCLRDQILQSCPAIMDAAHNLDGPVHSLEGGGSLETLRHMVASGMGITIIPESAANFSLYSQSVLTVRRFSGTPPKRTVGLAWRASFPRPKAMDMISRVIKTSWSHG